MMRICAILLFCNSLWATEGPRDSQTPLGVFYFSQMLGHVHQFSSAHSPGLATISCGLPLQVYSDKKEGWARVKAMGVEGHVQSQYLKPKLPICFQSRYPKFFDALELSATEIYYWARLPDLYVRGKSKVK